MSVLENGINQKLAQLIYWVASSEFEFLFKIQILFWINKNPLAQVIKLF